MSSRSSHDYSPTFETSQVSTGNTFWYSRARSDDKMDKIVKTTISEICKSTKATHQIEKWLFVKNYCTSKKNSEST